MMVVCTNCSLSYPIRCLVSGKDCANTLYRWQLVISDAVSVLAVMCFWFSKTKNQFPNLKTVHLTQPLGLLSLFWKLFLYCTSSRNRNVLPVWGSTLPEMTKKIFPSPSPLHCLHLRKCIFTLINWNGVFLLPFSCVPDSNEGSGSDCQECDLRPCLIVSVNVCLCNFGSWFVRRPCNWRQELDKPSSCLFHSFQLSNGNFSKHLNSQSTLLHMTC